MTSEFVDVSTARWPERLGQSAAHADESPVGPQALLYLILYKLEVLIVVQGLMLVLMLTV